LLRTLHSDNLSAIIIIDFIFTAIFALTFEVLLLLLSELIDEVLVFLGVLVETRVHHIDLGQF
jgi:hypothetical protein